MIMRALDVKLLRDIRRQAGALIAIALVMACGVAAMTMMFTTVRSLHRNLDTFYDHTRFADIFTHLKRAPLPLIERVRDIPGITNAEGRIVVDVTIDAPGVAEPAVARIQSIPDRGPPALNLLHLRSGRLPEPGRAGEVVVNEAFAEALHLSPGDSVPAVVNGSFDDLRIVGTVLSPEYVYALRPGGFVPDDRRFGIFWMREEELAGLYDMDGAFNDLVVRLSPGATEPLVLDAIDELTEPYGGTGAYPRRDQLSHLYINDELSQLQGMGTVMPNVFIGVSALLLNIVMTRLIRTQREQIAVLKAFGYRSSRIGLHFLQMVAIVSLTGSAIGVGVGTYLGSSVTAMYARFFRFPTMEYHFEPWIAVLAITITTLAASLGALSALRKAVRLPAAEGMRPEVPPDYRSTLIEKSGFIAWLSPASRMIVRHIERQPVRALVSAIGVGLAIGVLTLGTYVNDALNFLIDFQFNQSQRYDLGIGFIEPRDLSAVREMADLPGAIACEPFRAVPVRIRHDNLWRREALTGLPADPRLSRALDEKGNMIPVPPHGIVLAEPLAEKLRAKVGSIVTVEVLEGQRPVVDVRVEGIAATYIGTAAYMDIDALRRLMREGDVASGAYLTMDPSRIGLAYARLKETPGVASVTVKRAALDSFSETLADNILRMRLFNMSFACVIAIGVVYNSARIALAERSHELATLRVLGLYRSEIAAIFLGELAFLTLLAIPMGVFFGYWFCVLATTMMTTDTHRIPLVVSPHTIAFAVGVVLLAAGTTAWEARRKLDHLDLMSVLKGAT